MEDRRSPDPGSHGYSRDCLEPVLGGRRSRITWSGAVARICANALLFEEEHQLGNRAGAIAVARDIRASTARRLSTSEHCRSVRRSDSSRFAGSLSSSVSQPSMREVSSPYTTPSPRPSHRNNATSCRRCCAVSRARRTSRNDDEPRTTTTRPRLHRRRNDRPSRATQLTPDAGRRRAPFPAGARLIEVRGSRLPWRRSGGLSRGRGRGAAPRIGRDRSRNLGVILAAELLAPTQDGHRVGEGRPLCLALDERRSWPPSRPPPPEALASISYVMSSSILPPLGRGLCCRPGRDSRPSLRSALGGVARFRPTQELRPG